MSNEPIFSRRALLGWIAAALAVFACSIYFATSRKEAGDAVGPSTFSISAIGYAGIAEILLRLGVPVVKSQSNSLEKLRAGGEGSLLVIAEPRRGAQSEQAFRGLPAASTLLLVLPKWDGLRSETREGWIGEAKLKAMEGFELENGKMVGEAQWTLNLAVKKGEVIRVESTPSWTTNELGQVPTLISPMQLIRSDRLRPIVASSEGMLVGELRAPKRRIWILADPDVMANHGTATPRSPSRSSMRCGAAAAASYSTKPCMVSSRIPPAR
jgi:hypothetical protein